MPVQIKRYGWVRDLPDQRDHVYSAPLVALPKLPEKVDLRPQCPPVYNQGELGSCTANALAAAVQFGELKEKQKSPFAPSRLFIYYNERVLEHTVASDSGAQLRDGMKTLAKQGVCPEADWPYDIAKFADKPPEKCFLEATDHKVTVYQRLVQNLTQMKGCLASGFPFVFGFTVYDSFESPQVAKTGIVPLPNTGEQVLGGHAVMAVGYDDGQHVFIVRNSWGDAWGMKGYCAMPYSYLTQADLSSDFWTVSFVK
ncbi:MAG TPA: C1 family peptidase [Gemmataceae bacterium]|nr:C1 family peptidase [Gemmataceae bacterium]